MNTIDKSYHDRENKIRLHLAGDSCEEQNKSFNKKIRCGHEEVKVKSKEHKAHPDVNEKIKSFLSFSAQQNS